MYIWLSLSYYQSLVTIHHQLIIKYLMLCDSFWNVRICQLFHISAGLALLIHMLLRVFVTALVIGK